MRYWLLLLAACGGSESDKSCNPSFRSQVTHKPMAIASGRDQIGVSWSEQIRESEPIFHAAIVNADGTLGPEIRIGKHQVGGTTGKTTVLWHAKLMRDDCTQGPFAPTLQRGGETVHLSIAESTRARAATFDGQRYQLFWIGDARTLHHQSLDEDGTLGPVHDLPGTSTLNSPCTSAASDGAGTTFVRFDGAAYFIDTTTGALQEAWTAPQFSDDWWANVFYFAGSFHVVDYRWFSIDPQTRMSAQRTYPLKMGGANLFLPGTTRMYGTRTESVQALDTSFEPIETLPVANPTFGTWNDDAVYFDAIDLDPVTLEPGRIVLSSTGMWSEDIAVDSPVETDDNCNVF